MKKRLLQLVAMLLPFLFKVAEEEVKEELEKEEGA